MFTRLFFRERGTKRPIIGQSGVSVGDAQNARPERDLFEAQTIGVSAAVPPFVMPANEQLRAAISSGFGRFALAQHRMPCKVDALVVSSPRRSSLMPDLPTTVEAGYPKSDYNFWVGALVAAKTPREIVERLHKEINTLVQSQEISAQIRKLGADPLTLSIAEFQAMIDRELVENVELIKKAGIKTN